MKKYIGGYSILDLTDANVSVQANVCYNQNKPVLVYGANGERYFADTITKSGTNIIITKGGKTITIASDNTITNVGDVQNHLYSNNIMIYGDDENENSVYLFLNIISDKDMSTTEIENYIKNFDGAESEYLAVSGYCSDTETTYHYINYDVNKFSICDNTDTNHDFVINSIYNKAIQLF